MEKLRLNTFQIKIIALVTMTLDHIAVFQVLSTDPIFNERLRMIGRISAPLFLFILIEGLHHTRSKPKYILRLYLMSVITAAINHTILSISKTDIITSFGNILHTFFYTALFVYCIETILKNRKSIYSVLAAGCGIIIPFLLVPVNIFLSENGYGNIWQIIRIFAPSPLSLEYSFLFVLLGITWYFVNNKNINCIIFGILSLLSFFIPAEVFLTPPLTCFHPMYCNFYVLFVSFQWNMFLAIPFMLLYNGKKGKSMKYLFYIYYPLHQYVLFALRLFFVA